MPKGTREYDLRPPRTTDPEFARLLDGLGYHGAYIDPEDTRGFLNLDKLDTEVAEEIRALWAAAEQDAAENPPSDAWTLTGPFGRINEEDPSTP